MRSDISGSVDRRLLVKLLVGAGALLIADGAAAAALASGTSDRNANGGDGQVGPFVRINADNSLVVGAPSPEIGSGLHTVTTMMIAEEIGAAIDGITVRQLPVKYKRETSGRLNRPYGPQGGGGSFTTRRSWLPVRRIAAATREVILRAAAHQLGVARADLRSENSHIVHVGTGQSIPFSQVASVAAELEFPDLLSLDDVILKPTNEFRLLGTPQKQLGLKAVIKGESVYGIDAEMDNMLHAAILHAPTYTASIGRVNEAQILAMPDVVKIVKLEAPSGTHYQKHAVAVVAETSWAAQKARAALQVEWRERQSPIGDGTKAMHAALSNLVKTPGRPVVKDGDGAATLVHSTASIDAEYAVPSLAHAAMEPMNCIVHAGDDRVRVIEPGHNMGVTFARLSEVTGLDPDQIQIDITRTGGSFGRRLWSDYVIEAYWISKAVGRPIKLLWSRESDMSVDGFRVTSRHRVRAGVGPGGSIHAWHQTSAHATTPNGDRPPTDSLHAETVWEDNFPRRIVPNYELDSHWREWNIMQGAWRAPMPSQQGFVVESAMNELARKAGQDPLEFRLRHLADIEELPYNHWGGQTWSPKRLAACLQRAANEAEWGEPLTSERARGLAGYFTFGSYCALVVEVSVTEGAVRVHRVTAAIDCGFCLNPAGTRAQVEGGINDALSAALGQEALVENGQAINVNFDRYRMMRLADAPPEIDTHIVEGSDEVFGTGEISVPPLAPALTDAIFQLTNKQIRQLPIADQLV